MKKVRKILYPISVVYGQITKLRNKMFDKGILKSTKFDIPVIVVGNLSVGGTGKTPQIEYLINLLQSNYKVAVLSRGYKRKSSGFIIADNSSTAETIGDEPFQYYKKFKDIIVCVDADRVHAINRLKELVNPPEIILLDDAFQHRKVQGGLTILLTPYNDLYVDDTMLPSGNLRENIEGAERAQVIIVTKCPTEVSEEEQYKIANRLNPTLSQTVFFSTVNYSDTIVTKEREISFEDVKEFKVLLLTGIANPKPLVKFLERSRVDFEHLKYPDHYNFSPKDIRKIKSDFDKIDSDKKLILTTEKDYVRLNNMEDTWYLGIKVKFVNHGKHFDQLINNYVG
jgi:tetraacyldisaccharide 4'-kinase